MISGGSWETTKGWNDLKGLGRFDSDRKRSGPLAAISVRTSPSNEQRIAPGLVYEYKTRVRS